jgi:hypothetical protein
MTIVAGAACPEGVVIAGDSRSSVQLAPGAYRTSTDYARKVFAINDKFLAATFGWATLEDKTISGHVREFELQMAHTDDVGQVANELCVYFHARMQAHIAAGLDPAPPQGAEPLGFIVAGYDPAGVGHVMRVMPYGNIVRDDCQTNSPGGIWNGETDVMLRLIKGYDAARIDVSTWEQQHQVELTNAEYIINFAWFALQDAIDWTVHVARTTIDTQRFTNGTAGAPGATPTTGGTIEVATVTPGDGVRWISRTDLRG